MKEKNQREIVLDLLLLVEQKQEYSHIALQRALQKYQYMDKQARGFITKVFEGTIENRICIDYVIDRFSKTATADMRPLIRNLLRLSVFQMLYMDAVPVSAVCNEAVKLAKKRGMAGLGGFVNGVLRGIGRGRNQIAYPDPETDLLAYLSVVYSIPRWILEQWKENYGAGTARSIAEAVHRERPTTIRVNTGKCTVEQS